MVSLAPGDLAQATERHSDPPLVADGAAERQPLFTERARVLVPSLVQSLPPQAREWQREPPGGPDRPEELCALSVERAGGLRIDWPGPFRQRKDRHRNVPRLSQGASDGDALLEQWPRVGIVAAVECRKPVVLQREAEREPVAVLTGQPGALCQSCFGCVVVALLVVQHAEIEERDGV
ncbi:hypothetical protein HRbin26_02423 [bacterium HR26]|nr:hypothetical protein HRbin26_02423 [bacterium HR26]